MSDTNSILNNFIPSNFMKSICQGQKQLFNSSGNKWDFFQTNKNLVEKAAKQRRLIILLRVNKENLTVKI